MSKIAITILLSLLYTSLYSQVLQQSGNTFESVWDGQSVFGDLDNDGDMDILISGSEANFKYFTRIYKNNGTGTFTEVIQKLPGIETGSIDLDDFNEDGLIDILLVACVNSSTKATKLFKNKGNFIFEEVLSGLPNLIQGIGRFGDYDNDGDPDILLTGSDFTNVYHDIYRNDNGSFMPVGLGLPIYGASSINWADYDNDNDLDYIISGKENASLLIYKNLGDDKFVPVDINQPSLFDASLEWGDFNNDGNLDILMMGYEEAIHSDVFYIFKNNGNDSFEKISAGFDAISTGNAAWGDMDNDGDLDIVTTGYTQSSTTTRTTCVYINNNGTFSKQTSGLPQLIFSHVSLGDADNDKDLDIIITGATSQNGIIQPHSFLFLNKATAINTKPSAPLSLQAAVDGQKVTFSWGQASDGQTFTQTLSYNVYVGTTPVLDNIKSSASDIPTGYRKVVKSGNSMNRLSQVTDNLMPGTYYWGVQSIDASFIGSTFSTGNSFTVLNSIPIIQNFSPAAALPGTKIIIHGKNFIGTTAVEVNGFQSIFKIVNSTTINAVVPEGNNTGNIKITNHAGFKVSSETFCLIPSVSNIANNLTACPGVMTLEVVPKAGVKFHWTLSGGGDIIEDNNNQIKINWKWGGDHTLTIIPESCINGAEKVIKIHINGPVFEEVRGNRVPKTETLERYFVPDVFQESYEWLLSSGGTIASGATSNSITVKWTNAGTHQLKLYRSNSQCPNIKVESIQGVNVSLNAFSFNSSFSMENQPYVALADFDNDNDLDILSGGGKIYENKGNQIFQPHTTIIPVITKAKAFDFDGDNDADILIMSINNGNYEISIYENQGGFNFVKAWKSSEKFLSGEINFIDYDNDGDQDIFIIESYLLNIYENAGSGSFQKAIACPGYNLFSFQGSSSVLDINQDGLKDIVTSKGGIFINTGTKSFVIKEIDYLKSYYTTYSTQHNNDVPGKNLIWEDLTNDGLPDLAEYDGNTLKIHKRTGNTFTVFYETKVGNVITNLKFIDLTNDGYKDMLLCGDSTQIRYYDPISQTYSSGVQKFLNSSNVASIFDVNQDGSIDLIFPRSNSSLIDIYTNNQTQNLTLPTTPSTLTDTVKGPSVKLQWNGNAGNTFNIVVGTQEGYTNIVSPLSNITGNFQKDFTVGNTGTSLFYNLLLAPGTYYWSVQSVDSKRRVSPFSPWRSFNVSDSPLPVPTNLVLTSMLKAIELKWVDNATNETGYTIERSKDNVLNFSRIGEVNPNISIFTDTTFLVNGLYYYRVKANHPSGDSYYSVVESTYNAIISEIPFQESFELPFRWSQVRNEEENGVQFIGNDWKREKMIFGGAHGDYALAMYSQSSMESEAAIVSPSFDLSKTLNPYLTFSINSWYSNGYSVYISTNNGITWTFLDGYYIYPNTNGKWEKTYLSLSSYKLPNIRLKFMGKLPTKGFLGEFLYLDNIKVVEFPSVPKNVKIMQNASKELKITWDQTPFTTHYIIYRKIDSGSYIALDTLNYPNTFIRDGNLTPGTKYSYKLYAYNESEEGYSGYSDVVSQIVALGQINIDAVADQKMRPLQNRSIPVTISAQNGINPLQYSVTSDNPQVLPLSKIVLESTSSGLICHINADSEETGTMLISLTATDGTYTTTSSFTLEINHNIIPQITGTLAYYSINEDSFLDITLDKLKVKDSDNNFPTDFTFVLGAGNHYQLNESKVIIEHNFSGEITVPIKVFDGIDYSLPFEFKIKVLPINDQPVITGMKSVISIAANETSTLSVQDFWVTDLDNSETSLSLIIKPGDNYVIEGNKIKPSSLFTGKLTVFVQISDGTDVSAIYEAQLNITPINKANQAITFGALPAKTLGDASFVLTATTSSTLPVSYASSNTNVATITGNVVAIVGLGKTDITATQSGDLFYFPAPDVSRTLTVKANQTIAFDIPPTKKLGDPAFVLNAVASSGLPVRYVTSNNAVATILDNVVKIVGAGQAVISVIQSGNESYNAASTAKQTLTVKLSQIIDFPTLPTKVFGNTQFVLNATINSLLPIRYTSSNTSVATISDNSIVSIVGAGTTVITASQNGNSTYEAAENITQTLTILKQDQTITFGPLASKSVTDQSFTLNAFSNSNLPIQYSSSDHSVATVSGITVTIIGAGLTTITATQEGNLNYNSALPITQSLSILKLSQLINFEALPVKSKGDQPFNLNAKASSGLLINYTSSNPEVAMVSGNIITIVGVGSSIINASQPGNSTYLPAKDVEQTLKVVSITANEGDLASSNGMVLYPNPVKEKMIVQLPNEPGQKLIKISSMGGKIIYLQHTKMAYIEIDVRTYTPGQYFLVANGSKKVYVLKFIVQ